MIAHHKRLALFRAATATATSVRERSSWTADLAARHCCNVRLPQQRQERKNPTMGNIGSKKRTLVTATAAMACAMPRHAGRVLASGNSPNFKPSDHHNVEGKTATTKKNVQLQRQFGTNTNTNPHQRGPVPTRKTRAESPTPLPTVLRTLVRRLNEPVPLRATTPATSSSSLAETSTTASTTIEPPTVVEEQRRMAELADELVARYDALPPLRTFGMPTGNKDNDDSYKCERSEILAFLANDCRPNQETVQTAVQDYASSSRSHHHVSNNQFEKLQRATTPIYEGLTDFVLQQNAVTGMGFLISLREDLLSSMKYHHHHHQDHNSKARQQQQPFRDLDSHLKKTFQRWFTPGLLQHERITYDSTPAKIIEAIATKEAVHPMKSLDDLKERLGATKRVFALFHPCLPNQPLVFVHVALLPSSLPPSCMEEIMATASSETTGQQELTDPPEVAAFYSISNGVKGLAGVGLGEYLLKESIGALKEEIPSLQTFVTLSPIPRFRKWIKVAFLKEEQRQQQQQQTNESKDEESSSSFLLSKNDREALHRCGMVSTAWPFPWEEFLDTLEETDFPKLLHDAKTTTDKDIYNFLLREQDGGTSNAEPEQQQQLPQTTTRQQFFVLRSVLLKLASSYLFVEKHRGKPLDKVCGFHVGNGAELHDLHFGADLSRGGLSNSYGLMANYLYPYDNATVSRNQANFESSGFVVPVGPGVRQWLDATTTKDETE